jgi:hypothetical protein
VAEVPDFAASADLRAVIDVGGFVNERSLVGDRWLLIVVLVVGWAINNKRLTIND